MTIVKKSSYGYKKHILDLDGPDGNAFALLGIANELGHKIQEELMLLYGVTPKEIQKEMMSGDYKNLVKTFDKYFGKHFIIYWSEADEEN